jgi:hypothetical protein
MAWARTVPLSIEKIQIWHQGPGTQDWFDVPRHLAEKGIFRKPSTVQMFRSEEEPADIKYYTTEGCPHFAIALHRKYGYRIKLLHDMDTGELAHVYAYDPRNDQAIDIKGRRSEQELKNDPQFNGISELSVKELSGESHLKRFMGLDKPLHDYDEGEIGEAAAIIGKYPQKYGFVSKTTAPAAMFHTMGKAEEEPVKPLTVQGKPLTPNPHKEHEFNQQTGELHTPRGTFKIQLHDQPHKLDLFGNASKDYFNNILNRPDIQQVHQKAMKNWLHLNDLLHKGKTPDPLVAHSALFTVLSANNAVPMQELSYSRLIDTMKKRGINPSDASFSSLMGKGGALREAWKQSDDPKVLPTHAREYWQGPAGGAITQQAPSEMTGRKSGDIYKMQYLDVASDKLSHYPQLHGYLTDLVKKHGPDAQSAVAQMMADKHAGNAPMNVGAGFGPKIARYFYSMLGAGNTHVPDTHLIRHLFGLDSQRDTEAHKYLKDVLWDPRNTHLLNGIDSYYHKNYPTVKYVQDKYFGGRDTDQATFPAFWLHWLAIAPHEKMLGIGKPHAAHNVTDHTPYWDSAREILHSHGLDSVDKAEPQPDETPVHFRTASAMHDLEHKLGPSAASMVFFAELLPHLFKS